MLFDIVSKIGVCLTGLHDTTIVCDKKSGLCWKWFSFQVQQQTEMLSVNEKSDSAITQLHIAVVLGSSI